MWNHIQPYIYRIFAEDSTVVGLITDDDETAYSRVPQPATCGTILFAPQENEYPK